MWGGDWGKGCGKRDEGKRLWREDVGGEETVASVEKGMSGGDCGERDVGRGMREGDCGECGETDVASVGKGMWREG